MVIQFHWIMPLPTSPTQNYICTARQYIPGFGESRWLPHCLQWERMKHLFSLLLCIHSPSLNFVIIREWGQHQPVPLPDGLQLVLFIEGNGSWQKERGWETFPSAPPGHRVPSGPSSWSPTPGPHSLWKGTFNGHWRLSRSFSSSRLG